MKIHTLVLVASVAALFAACAPLERSRALNDAHVPAASTAAQVCSNCHGIDGNSVAPIFPRLAAEPAPYLEAQLKEFRSHNREDPEGFEYMWGISRHLTDSQIAGLAAYFSQQAAKPNAPGVAAATARGREIFEKGIPSENVPPCSSCHGPKGYGNDIYPRLAGQHAHYVERQLGIFIETNQRPSGAVMKEVAHQMTPQDVRAVAEYVQGLQ